MDKAKVVNHFSLNNIDLEELLRQQDTFFVNDDAVIIFNGGAYNEALSFIRKKYTKLQSLVLFLRWKAVAMYASICKITI